MSDILDDLKDLHKQATTERSHYYVASCCTRAIEEIEQLRNELEATIRVAAKIKIVADRAFALGQGSQNE